MEEKLNKLQWQIEFLREHVTSKYSEKRMILGRLDQAIAYLNDLVDVFSTEDEVNKDR